MAPQEEKSSAIAGMSKLPDELKVEVVRWAVKKDGEIDIRYFEEDVAALLAPFAGNEKLTAIAEEELYNVNVFRLSIGDTEASEWEYEEHLDIESRTTGPISMEAQKIRHLRVYMAIMLKGANFAFTNGEAGLSWFSFGDELHQMLGGLGRRFPRLRFLDFRIFNRGQFCNPQDIYWLPSYVYWHVADPMCQGLAQNEKILRMYSLLLYIASQWYPGLQAKTVEFVQDSKSSTRTNVDGAGFEHPTHNQDVDGFSRDVYDWERHRMCLMMCQMFGVPKLPCLRATSWGELSDRQLQQQIEQYKEASNLEMIQKMLMHGSAVVHFSDPRLRRSKEA